MESVPVEILEKMFLPLSLLTDIEKCFNTSTKWRQIIVKMFKNEGNAATVIPTRYLIFYHLFNYL